MTLEVRSRASIVEGLKRVARQGLVVLFWVGVALVAWKAGVFDDSSDGDFEGNCLNHPERC